MKRQKTYTTIIVILIILLIIALVLLRNINRNNSLEKEEINTMHKDTNATFTLNTKYGELHYPKMWEELVDVQEYEEDEVYWIEFSVENKPLFDVCFNGEGDYVIGTLKDETKNIVVSIKNYPIENYTENEQQQYTKMQEDVNVIIKGLIENKNFILGNKEENNEDVYKIDNNFMEIYYLKKWEEKIVVEETTNSLIFMYKDNKLFELSFGEEVGFLLGTYKDLDVCIITYDLDIDKLNENDLEIAKEMQSDMNIVIEKMKNNEDFKPFK